MFLKLSIRNEPHLDPAREKAIAGDLPSLGEDFGEARRLSHAVAEDTRGYTEMLQGMAGAPTYREQLSALAKSLAPRSAEVFAFAAKQLDAETVLDRAEVCLRQLKPQLRAFSWDGFLLRVIERGLEMKRASLDPLRVAQTVFDIAQRIGPVNATLVAADFLYMAQVLAPPEDAPAVTKE